MLWTLIKNRLLELLNVIKIISNNVCHRSKTVIYGIYFYIKIFIYAQYYFLRRLYRGDVRPVQNVDPWTTVLRFLDNEWRAVTINQRYSIEDEAVLHFAYQGPSTSFETVLQANRRIKHQHEQTAGIDPQKWATPSVEQLTKDGITEVLLGISDLEEHFPLRGAAFYNADFLEFVKQHVPKRDLNLEELENLRECIKQLLYVDAIQVFIRLHKRQQEKYRNLVKCFARIFVDSKKEIRQLCNQIENQTQDIQERWNHIDERIAHLVSQRINLMWQRITDAQTAAYDVKTLCESRLTHLETRVSLCHRLIQEGHTKAQEKIRDLNALVKDLQERLYDMETDIINNKPENFDYFAPDFDSQIDQEPPTEESEEFQEFEDNSSTETDEKKKVEVSVKDANQQSGGTLENVGATGVGHSDKPRHVRSPEAKKRRKERYRQSKSASLNQQCDTTAQHRYRDNGQLLLQNRGRGNHPS